MKTNDVNEMRKALGEEAQKALCAMEDVREMRLVFGVIASGKLTAEQMLAVASQCSRR
jgi:hypothetical protein